MKELLIVDEVCKKLNFKRQRVEAWRRCDPDFRLELEMVELEIDDRVKKLALQKMGIIPSPGKENYRWINDSLINNWLKQSRGNQVTINAGAAPLEIKGLSGEILARLGSPEAVKPAPVTPVDIVGIPKNVGIQQPAKDLPQ